jgi:uncharacterized protein
MPKLFPSKPERYLHGIVCLLFMVYVFSIMVFTYGCASLTAFGKAANQGDAASLKSYIEKGADVNAREYNGGTALWWAAWNGQAGVVNLLLAKGADINAQDNLGRTPLRMAAGSGHTQVVKLLLDKGADVNVRDISNSTALLIAVCNNQVEIVKLLLDNCIDVYPENKGGYSALMIARSYNSKEKNRIAQLLIGDPEFNATLFQAVKEGKVQTVRTLLSKSRCPGQAANALSDTDMPVLVWATICGNVEIVKLLVDTGAYVKAKAPIGGLFYTAEDIAYRVMSGQHVFSTPDGIVIRFSSNSNMKFNADDLARIQNMRKISLILKSHHAS